jgi:hypothetical protein
MRPLEKGTCAAADGHTLDAQLLTRFGVPKEVGVSRPRVDAGQCRHDYD